ncbi:MAG: pyruvate, water dikinase regulatory protein [Coriobacteriia bacterium]|nr:pyruvate, water dikinase regulatory protein [Coriobacteriia bacterium]
MSIREDKHAFVDALKGRIPTVHVISDSLGDTAADVALAAASQFSMGSVHIDRLMKAQTIEQVKNFLDQREFDFEKTEQGFESFVIFYTIADPILREELAWELERRGIDGLDLLGPAVDMLSKLTGEAPSGKSGVIRKTDARYFRRIDAMEYSVNHDDGRNPESLDRADIVLIGVSRTSKTPLSMYLAFQGYKVANVPLALGVKPPEQLYDIEPYKIFGLLSTPEVLSEIRYRRLGDDKTRAAAKSYADTFEIEKELKEARAFMRELGCIVIRTNNKAVEETAQEILKYYEAHELAQIRNDDV